MPMWSKTQDDGQVKSGAVYTEPVDALVIFGRGNPHWLAPILSKDCRHVWYCIRDPRTNDWLSVNAGLDGIVVSMVAPEDFDLCAYYQSYGYEVFPIKARPSKRRLWLPWMLNNCVGVTIQGLGLRSWAITPAQLKNHLRKEQSA